MIQKNNLKYSALLALALVFAPGSLNAQDWFNPLLSDKPNASAATGSLSFDAKDLDRSWNRASGDVVTRLSLDWTAFAGLQQGQMNLSEDLILGITAGAGYFTTDWFSADIDLSSALRLTADNLSFNNLALTPSGRFYPFEQFYFRLGLPIAVVNAFSVNALGGIGYEMPVGADTNLVGEISFIYPVTEEGEGTITIGTGPTFRF